jgi:hypothetical protein
LTQTILLCARDMNAQAKQLEAALQLPAIEIQEVDGKVGKEVVQNLRAASNCLLVCWSANLDLIESGLDKPVARAMRNGRCVSVRFDGTVPAAGPPPVDLSRWRGGSKASRIEHCLLTLRARRRVRFLGLLSLPPIALAVGFLVDVSAVGTSLCHVGGISGICAYFGWAGVPTPAQDQAFEEARSRGCDGLRSFVREQPDNPRAAYASRLIDAATPIRQMTWHPRDQRLPMYVPGSLASSRLAAQFLVVQAAQQKAADLCSNLETGQAVRVETTRPIVSPNCVSYSDGWRCSAEGNALCRISELGVSVREHCG